MSRVNTVVSPPLETCTCDIGALHARFSFSPVIVALPIHCTRSVAFFLFLPLDALPNNGFQRRHGLRLRREFDPELAAQRAGITTARTTATTKAADQI